MLRVVVINGIAAHGKDSFVKFASRHFDGITINHSTVTTVKEAAKFFGADQDVNKGDAERRLWSDMKDAWTRYNDGPFKEIIATVEEAVRLYGKQYDLVVFIHAREPGEIRKVKDYFGKNCITLLVVASNNKHIPDNHADQNVFVYAYDMVVRNDGTLDDLKNAAITFINKIGIKL